VRRIGWIGTLTAYFASPRLLDAIHIAAILVGAAGFFLVDIHQPRGILDGLGYPAVVALAARFGRQSVLTIAWLVSALIVAASFLLPDAGISVAGELANRFCALLSVWIVAMVLVQRLNLEQYIAKRDVALARHQQALLETVHRVLLVDMRLQDRIQRFTEIAAKSLDVGRVGVFRWREDDTKLVCLDMYRNPEDRHEITADLEENRHPGYLEAMQRELVAVADDIETAPFLEIRRKILAKNNVRAVIGAGIFLDGQLMGQIIFSHLNTVRHWTMEEIAYARAAANMMAILFSADRNSETLAALDLVSEGIYATAATGSLLYANRAARKIAAKTAQAADGSALPASAYPHPAAALEGADDEQKIILGDSELEIERTRLPRGGIITRIHDVTARNIAARESARLQKRLQQAAKMEAIGQLAGGIAHDFSNILSAIMGFSRFLEEDLPAESQEQTFARRILAACDRGKRLVDQVLDFALAKSARQDRVELATVIRQCEEHLRPVLPLGVKLAVEVNSEASCVTGSAVQLSQIITNLCTNARDAVGDRGGEVRLELSRVDRTELEGIAAGATDFGTGEIDLGRSYACIRVSDTGEGITNENLSRIFEPFFTTKGRQRGTGLGLAVVHGAVAAHQGACHVRSEPGVGTTMSIYLPLSEPGPARAIKVEDAVISGNERVLLVDDETDIVEIMSRGLCRLGYRAVGTDDPTDVLRAVETGGGDWDVVITDQMMPGMGGLELIRKIKALEPRLLAILCTGYGEAADEQSALKAGADAYVRKPADAEALARCIRRLRADGTPLPNPAVV
jgi:signal transduction histidine kinase/ActR/RegA family two-component response regulator